MAYSALTDDKLDPATLDCLGEERLQLLEEPRVLEIRGSDAQQEDIYHYRGRSIWTMLRHSVEFRVCSRTTRTCAVLLDHFARSEYRIQRRLVVHVAVPPSHEAYPEIPRVRGRSP